jgi:hypothetical protein
VELFMSSARVEEGARARACTGHYCYPGTTYSSAQRDFPPEVGTRLQLVVPV